MSNKSKKVLGLALSLVTLASCSTTYIRYPLDYKETLYPNIDNIDHSGNPVVENDKEQYYQEVLSGDTVYQKLVNQILLEISKIAHNNTTGKNGTDTSTIIKDLDYKSVMDGDGTVSQTDDNLLARAKESMESSARSGTYAKDNLFYEKKFVESLKEAFTLNSGFDSTAIHTDGKLITPSMKYADIYGGDYSTYMQKNSYDDLKVNYLTSEYIYNKSYASIGNTKARKVQVIALADRTDQPGAARKLLSAYVNDYVLGDKAGVDTDFSVLSRLWKGISADVVSGIDPDNATRYATRYDTSVVLSADEATWLRNNDILTDDESYTLSGKILDDVKTLKEGYENHRKVNSSLESTYTGSYTYDYTIGVRKAVDDIATKDLVTEGVYLSDGLTSLPSDLKTRIFSTKVSTSKADVDAMKADPMKKNQDGTIHAGTSKDYTVYCKDGFRYVTNPDNPGNNVDNLVYYDSTSKTYYLVRVLDAISTNAIASTTTDSVYDTDAKKEQIAREVAYAMSTTGTYKTDSSIYWLRRTNIDYSDEDFLTYMKSNYKDLFKTDSAFDSESKIILG